MALFRKTEKEVILLAPEPGAQPLQNEDGLQQPQHEPGPFLGSDVPNESAPLPAESEPVKQGVTEQQGLAEHSPKKSGGVVAATQPANTAQKSETRKEVENVLSEGVTEIYHSLTPQEQAEFLAKGKEAATLIEQLLFHFKAKAKLVLEIIRGWLSTIPRVNKFFLEQESKLKTDEIMDLQKRMKKQRRNSKGL